MRPRPLRKRTFRLSNPAIRFQRQAEPAILRRAAVSPVVAAQLLQIQSQGELSIVSPNFAYGFAGAGGNLLNSFCIALLSVFSFFSGLADKMSDAVPRHTRS